LHVVRWQHHNSTTLMHLWPSHTQWVHSKPVPGLLQPPLPQLVCRGFRRRTQRCSSWRNNSHRNWCSSWRSSWRRRTRNWCSLGGPDSISRPTEWAPRYRPASGSARGSSWPSSWRRRTRSWRSSWRSNCRRRTRS